MKWRSPLRFRRAAAGALVCALTLLGSACGGDPHGDPVPVVVERGSSFQSVVNALAEQGIIGERSKPIFRAYGRIRRADRNIRAGHYEFRQGESWNRILEDLINGKVVSVRLVVPEGFTLVRMTDRIAAVAGIEPDSASRVLRSSDALVTSLQVPGPTLEGYLFPDTYFFEPGMKFTTFSVRKRWL
jgi:UPF0755 protein